VGETVLQVAKHPPERRRRQVVTLQAGCCCCCCCCLHSVGSVIGAVVAGNRGATEAPERSPDPVLDDLSTERIGQSGAALFWRITVGLVGAIFGVVALVLLFQASGNAPQRSNDLWGALLLTGLFILMGFPLVQFASAIIALIGLSLTNRPDRGIQMKQVGRILVGTILGCVAGLAVMFGIGMLFSLH
jgi:hypothetical protein